jgi:hypothetical protein
MVFVDYKNTIKTIPCNKKTMKLWCNGEIIVYNFE